MTALLVMESVSVSYWRGTRVTHVLRDVSMTLRAGELGGVWGGRGSGKTTLAKVVAGLLAPETGRVLFDGHELGADRRGELHMQIGLATRRGPEFEEVSVASWIASTMLHNKSWTGALKRARLALDRVGGAELADKPWEHLSDGERMLVSIAQAIVRGPRLIVADDPVAGLGGRDRAEIMELLRGIAAEGVAVLMMAAELSQLHGTDQIWALDRGRLDGPPARSMGSVVPLRSA
jgi:ABC-type cobalamin/Fe3+-siderophores transport system ATPase subunit